MGYRKVENKGNSCSEQLLGLVSRCQDLFNSPPAGLYAGQVLVLANATTPGGVEALYATLPAGCDEVVDASEGRAGSRPRAVERTRVFQWVKL